MPEGSGHLWASGLRRRVITGSSASQLQKIDSTTNRGTLKSQRNCSHRQFISFPAPECLFGIFHHIESDTALWGRDGRGKEGWGGAMVNGRSKSHDGRACTGGREGGRGRKREVEIWTITSPSGGICPIDRAASLPACLPARCLMPACLPEIDWRRECLVVRGRIGSRYRGLAAAVLQLQGDIFLTQPGNG